jgi:uncharacterized protein YbjT (DUF2867 family)
MILAAGATGRLRPVVEELLVRGHDVRVTARDPGSSVARALAGRGVEIVRSDLDDVDSLSAAARGVDTIFAAGSPHRAGPEGETRHGINVAEAAADADVGHLVFSSGAGADQPTGVPVLDSKHAVEQRIHGLGVPHTILAPVYFMENAFNPWHLSAVAAGTFPLALPPDRLLQQLAIEDLAALAATVIERRDEFLGQRIELAGDELTGEQAAASPSPRFPSPVSLPVCARSSSGSRAWVTTSTSRACEGASPTSAGTHSRTGHEPRTGHRKQRPRRGAPHEHVLPRNGRWRWVPPAAGDDPPPPDAQLSAGRPAAFAHFSIEPRCGSEGVALMQTAPSRHPRRGAGARRLSRTGGADAPPHRPSTLHRR